jgi:uncharacterized protein (TIRG00374 family)
MMSKAFWYRLLPLAGFFILVVIVYAVGIKNILNAFRGLRCELLLILPLLVTSLLIAQTSKWQLILLHQEMYVPFVTLFRINLMGIFYGTITPGRAGVLLKVRYLADYCKRPVSEVSSSVVIDKLIELVVLGGFATVGSVLVAKSFGTMVFLFTTSVTLILVIVLVAFCHKAKAIHITKVLLFAFVPREYQGSLREHIDRFYGNIPGKASLLIPLLLSVCCWLLIWTQVFVIARALSMNLSYGLFIVIISVGSLISLIPITINGIGTRESALIIMFSAYGVAPQKTLAMSLLSLLLCACVPAVLGALQIMFFTGAQSSRAG